MGGVFLIGLLVGAVITYQLKKVHDLPISQRKVRVLVSSDTLLMCVMEIGGDRVSPVLLTKTKDRSVNYEFTSQEIRNLYMADVIFYVKEDLSHAMVSSLALLPDTVILVPIFIDAAYRERVSNELSELDSTHKTLYTRDR